MRKYTPDTLTLSLFDGKVCSTCFSFFSYSHFKPDIRKPDHLTHQCRDCINVARRKYMQSKRPPKPEVPEGMKKCCKCGEWKPFDMYWTITGGKLRSKCKPCFSAQSVQYKRNTYIKNKEKISAYNRLWWELHPEARQKKRLRDRKYGSVWGRANRDKTREAWRRRRKRKLSAPGSHTLTEWLNLCEKYDSKCLCCLQKKKLTLDHIIPLSRGGCDCIENIQPLCQSCNSSKSTKSTDYRPFENRRDCNREGCR